MSVRGVTKSVVLAGAVAVAAAVVGCQGNADVVLEVAPAPGTSDDLLIQVCANPGPVDTQCAAPEHLAPSDDGTSKTVGIYLHRTDDVYLVLRWGTDVANCRCVHASVGATLTLGYPDWSCAVSPDNTPCDETCAGACQ